MLEDLKRFFDDYPRQILQLKGVRPSDISGDLMNRLVDYRHRSLANLRDAQTFRIDPEAFWMMSELINEMKRDGLDELFCQVRLPFPTMIILPPVFGGDGQIRGNDELVLGVVTQIADTFFTQRFIMRGSDVGPSNCVMISKGAGITSVLTPTRDLFEATGLQVPERLIEDELASNRTFLGAAVAIATLLQHEGMLKLEEVSRHPRQQRRQAERSGKILPDTRISMITLGKAGRGQVEAMKDDIESDERGNVGRRTHWVRGHHMRSRSGNLVWRMPHLRGAGPLIRQMRYVTVPASDET